jgi:MerR family transcriptional regulator, mercuric resistance operon regulatory protein
VTTRGLRSGELAERAGVNVQTLRYYERRGLLAAPTRRPSGQREYPEGAVALLTVLAADCDSLTDCSCGLATPLPG